jgi:hypothetical protein
MKASQQLTVALNKAILQRVRGKTGYKIRQFVANQIITLSDPLIPFDKGYLLQSATIGVNADFVQWNMPYAKKWYYTPANFKGGPIRGNYWAERAVNTNKEQIINAINKGIKKGVF